MNWEERFLKAKTLLSKGLFNAARTTMDELENYTAEQADKNRLAQLHYEQGIICLLHDVRYTDAVDYFTRALSTTNDSYSQIYYTMNLALAYLKMAEYDTSYRYLIGLYDSPESLSSKTKGDILVNLSAIQGINGFYEQAIESIHQSRAALADSKTLLDEVILHNNMGLAYLELGQHDKAEFHLRKALEVSGNDYMEPLSELGRLCMLQGRIAESVEYAKRALTIVWSSIINYNKEEIARLCYLLAGIAVRVHEVELALRLGEKAQVLFGQLGMWRQWQNVESQLEEWSEGAPLGPYDEDYRFVSLQDVRNFLKCLEALNAQELIDKRISRLLDIRVYYTQIFARELELSDQAQEDLVLASRFADYGLTALESEVVMNPTRSEVAFAQYKQHPALSVMMATTLNLSKRVSTIIEEHHENFDGTGYPKGKRGADISYLARVLSVADRYVTGIVLEGMSHFEVLDDICSQSGTVFDPEIVRAFVKMHDVGM